MKKIISLIICLIMTFTLLPFGCFSEENVNPGDEYSDIEWSFDATSGTMTVSGTGKMRDFNVGNIYSIAFRRPDIKHVIIEEGITYIGSCSFYLCENIETISLPSSLREIGDFAFLGSAEKLKELDIPAGVRRIGSCAFLPTDNWQIIRFYGNAPEISTENFGSGYNVHGLLTDFKGIVYYPWFADSWTEEVRREQEKAPDSKIVWKEWDAPRFDHIEEIFLDLSYGAWYVAAVDHVYRNNIMKGTDKGFDPNVKLTREEVIQILYNIDGIVYLNVKETGFTDVSATHWAAPAIKWAKEKGITQGIGNGKFGLGQALSREQLATLLANYMDNIGFDTAKGKELSGFADHNDISDWATKGLSYCAGIGVIQGTDKNTILPKALASRAEVAQIFFNFSNYKSSFGK